MPRNKKVKGRPSKQVKPEAIPDTPTKIIRSLLRTRTKEERALLNKTRDKSAGAA